MHSDDPTAGQSFLDDRLRKKENDEPQAQDWKPDLSGDIDYIIPFPCIARDIQQWILKESIYPQPAIAFAAAMSVMSVAIGRNIAYENIKGNLMFIAMAESGEGKDFPFKAAKLILEAIGMGDSLHGKMASGAAFMDSLEESPTMLFYIDEFGEYLSSINGKNANQYSKEIVVLLTEAYTSANSSLSGKKTKGNAAKKIIEPNVCVFGLSTERQIFDGLKTSDLANGSLARYSLLFGVNGLLPIKLKLHNIQVPKSIIDDLLALQQQYAKDVFLCSTQLPVTEAYSEAKYDLVYRLKEKSNSLTGDNKSFAPMYNRAAVRCLQGAMLIDQCKSIETLNWFEKIEMASIKVFSQKFKHLGSDNENERLTKLLKARIKEAGSKGITAKELGSKTAQILPMLRKQLLDELTANNSIHIKLVKLNGSQRPTAYYFWTK